MFQKQLLKQGYAHKRCIICSSGNQCGHLACAKDWELIKIAMENDKKGKVEIDLKQLKSKCLRLLTKRDHSSSELKIKMKRYYEFSPDDFTEALAWLKELKYLPDENLMAEKLAAQFRKQGRGRQWIRGKLRSKGLAQSESLSDDKEELSRRSYAR